MSKDTLRNFAEMSLKNFFSKYGFPVFVAALIVFRFLFSLAGELWGSGDDVLQIYLIGLKSFTTHSFPYFGADLVYNQSQIPGALQGYLVSAGWYLWKIPEAPYIVLNILTDAALIFLAWYASKRLQDMQRIFIWSYIFLTSWSMCFFTQILNPAYMICGSIFVFIGIFEIYPQLSKHILSEWLSFFFLGFGFFWVMQLHMSWVLLVPFIAIAFYYQLQTKNARRIAKNSFAFIAGCIITGSLWLPTILKFGMANEQGKSVSGMVEFHPEHAANIFGLLGKFLIYGSFDVPRFTGAGTDERIGFLKEYPWAAPFTVFVAIAGIAFAIFLLYTFFRRKKGDAMLRNVTFITIFGFFLLFASSLFSRLDPAEHSHAAVIFFPLVILCGLYAMRNPLKKKWVRRIVIIAFASSIIFYIALGIKNYETISLYKNRDRVVQALEQDDYRIVGKRRYEK